MNTATFLDKAPRFIIYTLVLLMPVFFLPFTTLPIDFNKQALLAVGVLFAMLFWLIDVLRKGMVRLRIHVILLPFLAFIIVAGMSSYASGAFLNSFWGTFAEPDSFLNLLLFFLLFLVAANKLYEPAHVRVATYFFIAGAVLNSVFILVHSLLPSFLPWEFARGANFNPFGSVYASGIYAGGAFIMALAFLAVKGNTPSSPPLTKGGIKGGSDKINRVILGGAAFILFLTVLVINIWVAWVGVAIGSLLLVYFLSRRKPKDGVPTALVLPLFVFAIALTFLFIKGISFGGAGIFPPEVRLGREMTMQVAQDTVKSSTKNALFGSGPATFHNQYNLYKSPDINNTSFWNARFDRGTGAITSFFITTGILGGGLLALFWALFLIFGTKRLLGFKSAKKQEAIGKEFPAVFLGGLYLFVSWALYDAHFVILFGGFFMVALWLVLHGKTKEIHFVKTPQGTFWGMAGGTMLLVFVLLGLYTVYKNYSAELSYARGVKYADEKDYVRAIPLLQQSVEASGLDKRWRKLSQVFFLQSSKVFKNQDLPIEKRREVMQKGLTLAESAAKKSILANPNSSINFEQLGNFYRNSISLSGNAFESAISNYDKASELNPQSPYIPLFKARAYISHSQRIKPELDALQDELMALITGEVENTEENETKKAELRQRVNVLQSAYAEALGAIVPEIREALRIKEDFAPAQELLSQIQEASE